MLTPEQVQSFRVQYGLDKSPSPLPPANSNSNAVVLPKANTSSPAPASVNLPPANTPAAQTDYPSNFIGPIPAGATRNGPPTVSLPPAKLPSTSSENSTANLAQRIQAVKDAAAGKPPTPVGDTPQTQSVNLPQARTTGDKISGALNSAADFLGIKKAGQGLASAARVVSGSIDQTGNEEGQALRSDQQIKDALNKLPIGDPKRISLINTLRQNQGLEPITQAEIDSGTTLSNKEVLGSFGNLALDIAGGSEIGGGAADSFKLAKPALEEAAPIVEKTLAQKATDLGTKVAKGAATGYAYDVAQNLQNNKSGNDIVKPGAGTVIGGSIPIVGAVAKGLGYAAKEVIKQIASSLSGVPKAAMEEAFKNPETVQTAIKTAAQDGEGATQRIYQNAVDALDTLKQARAQAYDQKLAQLEKDVTYTKNGQMYVNRVLTDAEAKATKGYVPGTVIGVPTKLSTNGIKNVFTTTVKQFGAEGGGKGGIDFTNVALDDAHIAKLGKLQDRIYNWSDTTPTGINKLRQVIDSYKVGGVNLGSSESKFNKIIGDLRTNLSNYVGERVPQISQMNSEYA